MKKYLVNKDRKYSDFGILYRINAQSRIIEDYLMSEALPYKVVGGLKFYDRKEIKDVISYLRVFFVKFVKKITLYYRKGR